MKLTGSAIRKAVESGDIMIDPFDPKQLNPNSYDLRLSPYVMQYDDEILDAAKELKVRQYELTSRGLVLMPGELYLMATVERTATDRFVPCVEGRSSTGRLGISVHETAGFGDIGFDGTWTLEVSVKRPVRVYAGMRICQVFFETCTEIEEPGDRYQGKYNGQIGPRPSKIWTERDEWLRN